jgi:hypothetical protein
VIISPGEDKIKVSLGGRDGPSFSSDTQTNEDFDITGSSIKANVIF